LIIQKVVDNASKLTISLRNTIFHGRLVVGQIRDAVTNSVMTTTWAPGKESRLPVLLVEGVYIYDDKGKQYWLDLASCMLQRGYDLPRYIIAAVTKQMTGCPSCAVARYH
jgi:4-aminobutyrate aminotransferase-like enzyme